jgi:predicted DNA binding CopG/RHH family protein
VPKNNVSVRLNDHQLEKLRYLAKARGISQQKIMNEILLPAIEEQAEAAYRRR